MLVCQKLFVGTTIISTFIIHEMYKSMKVKDNEIEVLRNRVSRLHNQLMQYEPVVFPPYWSSLDVFF